MAITYPFTYTNASSAESKIRAAIASQLGNITTTNGYINDIGDISTGFPGEISYYPAITVLTGYEVRDHYDNETLYIMMKVPLLVFVDPEGTLEDEIESIKQDIHYLIGNNPGLPDEDADTCQLAIFSSAEPFGAVLDNPQAGNLPGVKIVLDITYQQSFADPTVN